MELEALLARQHGAVSFGQAVAAGLSRHAVAHRVATDRWRRVLPRTYVVVGRDAGDLTRWAAALLWAPEGSALSHGTAAVVHGLPVLAPGGGTELTVPGRAQPTPLPGIVLHRPRRWLEPVDLGVVNGLTVTSRARCAVELAAQLPPRRRAGFLIACLQQRRITLPELHAAAARLPLDRGVAGFVASLDPQLQSASEAEVVAMLRGAGLAVRTQLPVRLPQIGWVHLDVAIESTQIDIEVDGWQYHSSTEAVVRDRQRDELLRLAGWEVIRVLVHELADPEPFIRRVWAAHALRSVTRAAS